jgi:hypothetical protein
MTPPSSVGPRNDPAGAASKTTPKLVPTPVVEEAAETSRSREGSGGP